MAVLMVNGVKFYPVCSVEKEHIFYNEVNRTENMLYNCTNGNENFKKLTDAAENAYKAREIFDAAPRRGGLIYASWKDGQLLKSIIAAYKIRLDEKQAAKRM